MPFLSSAQQGDVEESQLGHIKMAEQQVGGAGMPGQPRGVGSLSQS